MSSLLISLVPFEELSDDDEYDVHIVGLIRDEHQSNRDLREELSVTVSQVSAAVDDCKSVNVIDTDVLSELDFTLHNLQYFVELTFDDLSFRADPPDPRLPQI